MRMMTMIINTTFNNLALTQVQSRCVDYEGDKVKNLIISGVAGSGKSVVIMKRAVKLYKASKAVNKKIKVCIFTYANTLIQYMNENFNAVLGESDFFKITTIDSYCYHLYRQMRYGKGAGVINIIKERDRKDMVEAALANHRKKYGKKHRFYELNTDFWLDEFKWIKGYNLLPGMIEDYMFIDRKGRGGEVRMSSADRAIAFQIYEEYCKLMKQKRKLDWEDIYSYILDNKDKIPDEYKFDHILVDEAQDLSFIKLLVAVELSPLDKDNNHVNITLAADRAQKIYKTTFSWKSLGIDVYGIHLQKSFRSTKQIVMLADSLISHNKNKEEYTKQVIPDAVGPMPKIISSSNAGDEKTKVISLVKKITSDSPNETLAIIVRTKQQRKKLEYWMAENRLQYQVVSKKTEWSSVEPGIKLVTMHSSKGLEFNTVIIPSVEEGKMPLISSDCEEEQVLEELERERSLLYVAMTRAKNSLILTYSGKPSRFISEMDSSLHEKTGEDKKKTNNIDDQELERILSQILDDEKKADKKGVKKTVNKEGSIKSLYESNGKRLPITIHKTNWKVDEYFVVDRIVAGYAKGKMYNSKGYLKDTSYPIEREGHLWIIWD